MSPRRTFGRIGSEPSKQIFTEIQRGRVLALIFDEDEYVERRLVARHRIIGEFARAIDPATKRGTDNYIIGAGRRISELADYLLKRMQHRRDLITKYDLPPALLELTNGWISQILAVATKELVVDELIAMRDSSAEEIYWINGYWQAIQSLIDEYGKTRESIAKPHQVRLEERRAARGVKFDRRTEHGRVRTQRKASGLAAGTSTGGVPFYAVAR